MKKKLLCLLLAAALLAALFPAALAEDIAIVGPAADEGPIRLVSSGAELSVAMSVRGVTLGWDAVEGAESYELSRLDGEDWLVLATLAEPGYTDADVRMGESCAYRVRALVDGVLTELGETAPFVFEPFSDVSGTKTLAYLAWAYNEGIVRGTSDTCFSPKAECSRIQFVMMLWKMNGSPVREGEIPFADVSGEKSTQALLWALDEGIVRPASRFSPDKSISRVQVVMILWKLAGSPAAYGTLPFTDVSGSKTGKAVLWAWQSGITKGVSETSFLPDRPCTRIQLVVFLYKFTHSAPGPAARQLELRVSYRGAEQKTATDADYNTKLRISEGGRVQLSAAEEICALYIVWEDYPLTWTLRSGEQEERHGENGFLHELVRVRHPAAELELQIAGSRSHSIADVYAFTAGTLPDWVQDWKQPWDKADLLVVPTHSDDEFIFMGGVIPRYVDKGLRVQVIYIIGHTGYRRHEQLNSLWVAGVDHVPISSTANDIYCGSLEEARWYYSTSYMTGYLVEQLRRFQPEVVVGHAEDGDSGHGVHIFGVMCLKNAVTLAAQTGSYSESEAKYGLWDVPKLYLHLYGPPEEMTVLDYETPLSRFGGRTAFEVACDAFRQCVTQYAKGTYEIYGTGSRHDTHKWGLYRSLVGPDEAKDDLFEHLDPA